MPYTDYPTLDDRSLWERSVPTGDALTTHTAPTGSLYDEVLSELLDQLSEDVRVAVENDLA